MSEQAPPPEDTPAVAGPEGHPAQAEDTNWQDKAREWEDRYTHLQPEYTRTTQEAATLRERDQWYELLVTSEDPDTRRQAAEALGYQLEEEQDQSQDDPYERVERRLGQVEESLTAAQQREADAEQAAYVRQVFDQRLETLGIDKEDQDWVLAYAINALPVAEDGWPDIDQSFKVFQEREDARQKKWAKSKRAPHISPNGQSASEAPNLDDRQQRQAWMVRRLQENEQAQ